MRGIDLSGSFDMAFGERLGKLRLEKGLSQAELGRRLEVHRSVVASYETNRAFPSVAVLKKMAELFRVSVDWLLFDEPPARDVIRDKELLDYCAKADHLERRERSQIKDFIDGVLARNELEEFRRATGKKDKAA